MRRFSANGNFIAFLPLIFVLVRCAPQNKWPAPAHLTPVTPSHPHPTTLVSMSQRPGLGPPRPDRVAQTRYNISNHKNDLANITDTKPSRRTSIQVNKYTSSRSIELVDLFYRCPSAPPVSRTVSAPPPGEPFAQGSARLEKTKKTTMWLVMVSQSFIDLLMDFGLG